MELGIVDRLRLLAILPEKGSLLTIQIVRTLREELSFSEEEHKEFGIVTTDSRITWNNKAKVKDIDFGDKAKEIVEQALRDLDSSNALTVPDLALWELFVDRL